MTKASPRIKNKISDFKSSQVPNRIDKENSRLAITVKFKSNKDFKNLRVSSGKLDGWIDR